MKSLEDLKKIDLNKIDLKNINVNALMSKLTESKDMMGQIVVAGLSIFIFLGLFGDYSTQKKELEVRKKGLLDKAPHIEAQNAAIEKVGTFKSGALKGLTEDELAAALTDMASQNAIEIFAYSPLDVKDDAFSTTVSASIGIKAGSYVDFLKFLRAIDKSPLSLKVGRCSVQSRSQNIQGQTSRIIEVQMHVSSVAIK